MNREANQHGFTNFGKIITARSSLSNMPVPFADHPQLQFLLDILSRKENHHAILHTDFSSLLYTYFINAIAIELTTERAPPVLRGARILYLDMDTIAWDGYDDLATEAISNLQPYIFVLANGRDTLFPSPLRPLLSLSRYRFILLSKVAHSFLSDFQTLELTEPSHKDLLTILKIKRFELEQYHQVNIQDSSVPEALQLAERYLSVDHPLDKAMQLLDSAAARASRTTPSDAGPHARATVTSNTLAEVLSTWTAIPASHLNPHQFSLSEFAHSIQQRIFGQEAAISIIGHALQQAQARLRHNTGPFCSFLFAGEENSGKQSLALALVEQLFKQLNILHFAPPFNAEMTTSLIDIKLQRCYDKKTLPLKDVVRDTPYAVIFFSEIEQASPAMIDSLQQLIVTGHLQDSSGKDYDLRQTIIILSTTLGGTILSKFASQFDTDDTRHPIDLMHLIMHTDKQKPRPEELRYTPEELTDQIMPAITMCLPETLCQHLHVVPFMPLDSAAIEKIICLKLRILGRQLEAGYSITLSYAQEVIHHLAKEVTLTQKTDTHRIHIDKMLRHLYFSIEHAIFNKPENGLHSKQLALQLNETGQLLRCIWIQAGGEQFSVVSDKHVV